MEEDVFASSGSFCSESVIITTKSGVVVDKSKIIGSENLEANILLDMEDGVKFELGTGVSADTYTIYYGIVDELLSEDVKIDWIEASSNSYISYEEWIPDVSEFYIYVKLISGSAETEDYEETPIEVYKMVIKESTVPIPSVESGSVVASGTVCNWKVEIQEMFVIIL